LQHHLKLSIMRRSIYLFFAAVLYSGLMFTSCKTDNPIIEQDPVSPQTKQGFFTHDINKLIDANYPLVQANGYEKLVIPASMYDESALGLNNLPTNAANDMKIMLNAGYDAYVNGGTVRDAILGKEAHDVDFSTSASADQILAIFPGTAEKLHAFGNYYVVKVYHPGDIETDMGPMMSIYGYDPNLQGKGGVPYSKYQGETYCNDLMEDSYTRDFTFNAIYYDCKNGDLIDYHGGLHDLREGYVDTNYESDVAVPADPRKVLRGIRFLSKFDFKFSDRLEKTLRSSELPTWLAKLDKYNVSYNLESGFQGGFVKKFFHNLQEYKVLENFACSMNSFIHTSAYNNEVESIFEYMDKSGKIDKSAAWAVIFWPRVQDELKSNTSPTKADIAAVWDQLNSENSANLKFETTMSSFNDNYVPDVMKEMWYMQFVMGDAANQTAEKVAELNSLGQVKNGLLLFLARASYDESLKPLADYWKEQLGQ